MSSNSTRSTAPESRSGDTERSGVPAVGYVRLSQESDRSITAQKEEIRQFCADQGLDLLRIYDDGERASGFDDTRPAYQEMLVAVEDEEIGAIVARDRDRLSRDKRERAAFLDDMNQLGVDVYAASTGDRVDMDSGEEWLIEMVRAYMDDVAKRREIERARREVQRRVEKGFHHGRPPFGFQFDDRGEFLEPDPDEYSTALEILDRRDAGESYREIGEAVGVSKDVVSGVVDRRQKYDRE